MKNIQAQHLDRSADISSGVRAKRLLLLITLALLGVCSYGFGIILSNTGAEALLMGVAITSMVIVMIPFVVDKKYFLFEPVFFVALSVLFGLTLKTFYVILGYNNNPIVTDKLMNNLTIEDLQFGTFVLMLGLLTFVFGYLLELPPLKLLGKFRSYKLSAPKMWLWSFVFLGVSFIAFVLLVVGTGFSFSNMSDLSQKRFQSEGVTSANRMGELNYVWYRIALIAKAPMYLMFYMLVKHKLPKLSKYGFVFLAALVINVMVPFFVSNKAGIILPLADLAIIAFIVTGKLNWRWLGSALLFVLLLIAVVATFRAGGNNLHESIADRIFGGRYFVGVTKSAHIINAFPRDLPYFEGATFLAWLNIVLPSSLEFDNSAFTGLGFYLGYHVFNLPFSGVPPGIIPEMYINFGIWGVLIGMFVVGVILNWLHHSFFRYIDYIPVAILYAVVTVRMPIFLFNNGFAVSFLKTAADVVIVYGFLWLVKSSGVLRNRV